MRDICRHKIDDSTARDHTPRSVGQLRMCLNAMMSYGGTVCMASFLFGKTINNNDAGSHGEKANLSRDKQNRRKPSVLKALQLLFMPLTDAAQSR